MNYKYFLRLPIIITFLFSTIFPAELTNNININLSINGQNSDEALQLLRVIVLGNTVKKNFLQEVFDYSCSCSNILFSNKKRTFIVAVCGLYTVTQYKLLYLTKQLTNTKCWSLWRHEKSLENLFAIPQNQLIHQLVADIQQRYCGSENLTNFMQFLNDLETEHKYLIEYKNLCYWLEKVYILRFSLIKTIKLPEIEDRLKRLAYIKALFLNWIPEYKLETIKIAV